MKKALLTAVALVALATHVTSARAEYLMRGWDHVPSNEAYDCLRWDGKDPQHVTFDLANKQMVMTTATSTFAHPIANRDITSINGHIQFAKWNGGGDDRAPNSGTFGWVSNMNGGSHLWHIGATNVMGDIQFAGYNGRGGQLLCSEPKLSRCIAWCRAGI
jgi:hypothetical protein